MLYSLISVLPCKGIHSVRGPHVCWSWADGLVPGLVGSFVPRVLLCALDRGRHRTGTLRAHPESPLTPIGAPEPFCRPARKTTAQRSTGSHAGK